jgi:hypothetical protein
MDSLIFAAGLSSFGLGAAMTLFAWNVVRRHRRRDAARAVLLSQLAFPGGAPAGVETDVFRTDESRSEPLLANGTLFDEAKSSGAASRRTIAVGAVGLMLTIFVGTYWWFAGGQASAPAESEAVASATTVAVTPSPQTAPDPRVELLALNHEARRAAFVVTGRIRNPVDGAPLHDVVAVVHVVDGAGRVLMTVRAPIKRAVLNAGEWSEFSAAASKATNVARYRVEFHARERQSLPQIDLRPREADSRS